MVLMQGVLIVAHGSRAKQTEATLEEIVGMVQKKMPDKIIEHAYMEFGEKTIEAGISSLAGQGVTEVKIAPYFLFTGVHIKEDIPEAVGECIKKYPGVTATMCETLGADERLSDILADRIKNSGA